MIRTTALFLMGLCIAPSVIYSFSFNTKALPVALKITARNAGPAFKSNSIVPGRGTKTPEGNHAPEVKITAPATKSTYAWNSTVAYSISVADKEDGESQYQEITPEEVFLEVKYVPDASRAAALAKSQAKADPAGLAAIKKSNCLNCHAFNAKLIGPSFYEITRRYPPVSSNIALLAKRVKEGSTGIWGKESMPTHPELTNDQAKSIVQWLMKNASQPDLNYYRGLDGAFRLKLPPAGKQKGVYVLTASYADHGLPDHPEQSLKGQDVVIISGK